MFPAERPGDNICVEKDVFFGGAIFDSFFFFFFFLHKKSVIFLSKNREDFVAARVAIILATCLTGNKLFLRMALLRDVSETLLGDVSEAFSF